MSGAGIRSSEVVARSLLVWTGGGSALALLTAAALSLAAGASEGSPAQAAEAAAAEADELPADPAEPSVELAVVAPVAPAPPSRPPAPERRIVKGSMRPGDSLSSSFARAGLARALAFRIDRLVRPEFSFRRAQPGHTWTVQLDGAGALVDFRYALSRYELVHLFYDHGRPVVRQEEANLNSRRTTLQGRVESTLYEAVTARGEDSQLAHDFSEIFAWDLDFTRSVRAGDAFRVLYERLYRVDEDGSETYLRPGRILAAHYEGEVGSLEAVYFEREAGRGGYYRPDGTSVEGKFLKAPVRHARVTSRYSSSRLHPILKIKRPHHGIDYAAPHGEPVWAVADGRVIERGWAGGFGNLVKIRHRNGYVSYYTHLSRFARGLKVGSAVRQKQVIGYVGQTGLATGPHVCFRIAKAGRYVNPATIRMPAGDAIPDRLRADFVSQRDLLLAQLQGAGPVIASPRMHTP